MAKQSNENGYALLIVLFAVVFILLISAVFMRGAVSNAKQEKIVDENNLVVVSAEAGVEYYTWDLTNFFLKQSFEEDFDRMVNQAIEDKVDPIPYNSIIGKIAKNFDNDLSSYATAFTKNDTVLFSGYSHSFKLDDIQLENDRSDEFRLTLYGVSEGKREGGFQNDNKTKDLRFELVFDFPKILIGNEEGSNGPGTSDDIAIQMPKLKEPKSPTKPIGPLVVNEQSLQLNCTPIKLKIENAKCKIPTISEEAFTINKSDIFLSDKINSWGQVKIENSNITIRNDFTPASVDIEDTDIAIGGKLVAYQAGKINKTKLTANSFNIGGTAFISNSHMSITNKLEFQVAKTEGSVISADSYKAHGQADFNKSNLTIATSYNSGGAKFENSVLEVGGKLNSGGGLFEVEGSHVTILGDAHTANGSNIENSTIHIGGYFLHTSKPLKAENADIFVGGKVTATNGTSFEDANMVVGGDYESSTEFKLDDTNLSIGRTLTLGNGGNLEDTLLIAKKVISKTTIDAKDSIVVADYLKSDVMKLENSKVCVRDLDVRSLSMENSKIYYTGSSNPEGKRIIKLPIEEFEKICGVNFSTTEAPDKKFWKPKEPVIDKVVY